MEQQLGDVSADFREGYGEGMSAAIEMLRRTLMADEDGFRALLTEGVVGLLNVADRKIDAWKEQQR